MTENAFNYFMWSLILVGGFFAVTFHDNIIGRIGEAVFIAASISVGVEKFIRKRFAKEVAKDIAPILFAYNAPTELLDEIDHIRRIKYVRRDSKIELRFKKLKENLLVLETSMTFSVENVTGDPQPYMHAIEILEEKYGDIAKNKIIAVSATGNDIDSDYTFSHPNVPLEPQVEPEDAKGYWASIPVVSFRKTVLVDPNKDNAKNRFHWKVSEVVDESDSSPIYFLEPTIGVNVNVIEAPPNLEVDVLFGHRIQNYEKFPPDEPNWIFKGAFLSLGSIVVSWKTVGTTGDKTHQP